MLSCNELCRHGVETIDPHTIDICTAGNNVRNISKRLRIVKVVRQFLSMRRNTIRKSTYCRNTPSMFRLRIPERFVMNTQYNGWDNNIVMDFTFCKHNGLCDELLNKMIVPLVDIYCVSFCAVSDLLSSPVVAFFPVFHFHLYHFVKSLIVECFPNGLVLLHLRWPQALSTKLLQPL